MPTRTRHRSSTSALAVLLALLTVAAVLVPADPAEAGRFRDTRDTVFEDDIERIAAAGITRGCNPPAFTEFCPDDPVSRGQLAAMLSRALELPAARSAGFRDTRGSTFEGDIDRLAAAGITRGCNPPSNTQFCVGDTVTRGQLAAMLSRALDLPAAPSAGFRDTRGSTFERDIDRIAAAGITRGCNPPANTEFCTGKAVTRGQLAAMLARALDLPPAPASSRPAGSTHLVIDRDRTVVNRLVLRPGDTIEFRNGARLIFEKGGYADWQGTPTSTWSNAGRTMNLERDIEIYGEGAIMFHAGSRPSTIRYVEFDLQPKQELGHYPLHWHLAGNSTRGTLVEGTVVKNSTNRAYVPHGSHGITFRNTIAYNIEGAAYWWDQPPFQGGPDRNNSNDITYDRALAHTIRSHHDDVRGFRLAAFELGAGKGNAVRNSVARNIEPGSPKDCSGFGWPELANTQPTTWGFKNNATYASDCHGIFVWQNNQDTHIVDGFRGDQISHGAYNNRYDYRNVDVEGVIVHAVGWSITGGHVGDVLGVRSQFDGTVTFQNVSVDSFTVDNRGSDGKAVHYRFRNVTGIGCGSVDYDSVVPGTRVTINGTSCRVP